MRKVDKISAQFENIITCLDEANREFQKLPVEFVNQSTVYEFHTQISDLINEVEELHYDTCVPLEMEAEERETEIKVLEKRLAELKSSR